MNKKIISKILVIITMLGIMMVGNTSMAYVGDGYTIDIPSTFTQAGSTAAWAKSTGDSVNIQVQNNTDGETASYTTLNSLIEQLKASYSITVSKQEVTTLNGYDCLHIVYTMSGLSIEQYAIPTKDKIFVITVGAVSSDFLTSSEAKGIVNSFKITNYVKPGSTTTTNPTTNTTSNTLSNSTSNTLTNTNDDNKISKNNVADDDDDDDDKNTSKKKKSSDDDDEDNNWVIIAIIAGAAVLCVAIIGIVIAVVVSKGKKQ